MLSIQTKFTVSDESTGIEHFLNLIRGDPSFSNMGTIQRGDLLTLLMESIKYGLSIESGIPLEIKLKEDLIEIYAKRSIEKKPDDFDEISERYATSRQLVQVKEGDVIFALDPIKTMPVTELNQLQQSTVLVISKKLNEIIKVIEKEKEYQAFKNKKGHLVEGVVARLEAGNVIVDVNGFEALLPKTETIPGEFLNMGDRIYVYIREVRMAGDNLPQYQILLNRSSPEFVIKLLEVNVPEIANGTIVVKDCARRPGRLSKVALASMDSFMNPVWPCIGKEGSRLKHIRTLMANEGLHLIHWSSSPAEYICSALYPLEVVKIIFESESEVEVVMSENSFNQALSRDKIQIRLAAFLTKYKIKVISEKEDVERAQISKNENMKLFKRLNLSDEQIDTLVGYGISSIDSLIEATNQELESILPSCNPEKLREEAATVMQEKNKIEYTENNIDLELLGTPYIVFDAPVLVEYGVKLKQDIAKLDLEILINMLKKQLYASDVLESEFHAVAEEITKWAKKDSE